MSMETALDNIRLRASSRWAHTEFSLEYHPDYLASRCGRAADSDDFGRAWRDRFAIDLRWMTDDGLIDWAEAGRTTDMGHGAYAADGSDRRKPAVCPFATVEEVWAFDAAAEYGLPAFDEQVQAYEDRLGRARRDFPGQLTTGGVYKSVVSGAIAAFGWEMLLTAAADARKFEAVLDGFFRRTLFHMEAWARTSAEVIIQHDDFVWSNGPFMHPAFYRDAIIPRYAELWKPLRAAGKRVLFCSDGDFSQFAGDVADAGADGFIFEPCMDFASMAERFGQTHCLVGSCVDCVDMTLGRWEKVRADIDRTFDLLADCRGGVIAVGNHLPPNVPEAMLDRYFEAILPRLTRG